MIKKLKEGDIQSVILELERQKRDEIRNIWHFDDVKGIANDLTDDECREVLQLANDNHDATIGINWDTLEYWANEIRNNKNQ